MCQERWKAQILVRFCSQRRSTFKWKNTSRNGHWVFLSERATRPLCLSHGTSDDIPLNVDNINLKSVRDKTFEQNSPMFRVNGCRWRGFTGSDVACLVVTKWWPCSERLEGTGQCSVRSNRRPKQNEDESAQQQQYTDRTTNTPSRHRRRPLVVQLATSPSRPTTAARDKTTLGTF